MWKKPYGTPFRLSSPEPVLELYQSELTRLGLYMVLEDMKVGSVPTPPR